MITRYTDRFDHHEEMLNAYLEDSEPRVSELRYLIEMANIQNRQKCLNIPFEGGKLSELAPHARFQFADFSLSESMKLFGAIKTDINLTSLPDGEFDALLSIVPLHHFEDDDQFRFLVAAKRTLKKDGGLYFGEVKAGSCVSVFLDTLVHQHTESGHIGNYLKDDFEQLVTLAGFKSVQRQTVSCPLRFSDENNFYSWSCKLFGLKSISKSTLIDQTNAILGIVKTGQTLEVNWELDFIRAHG